MTSRNKSSDILWDHKYISCRSSNHNENFITILIASIIHDFLNVVSQLHRLTFKFTFAPRVRTADRLCRVLNWNDYRIYLLNLISSVTVLRFCALPLSIREIRLHPIRIPRILIGNLIDLAIDLSPFFLT